MLTDDIWTVQLWYITMQYITSYNTVLFFFWAYNEPINIIITLAFIVHWIKTLTYLQNLCY